MRRSIVCQLSWVAAAAAAIAGVLTVATPAPAQAEFEKERQLYLLMRVELENAKRMERYYQARKKEFVKDYFGSEAAYASMRAAMGCDNYKKERELTYWELDALYKRCSQYADDHRRDLEDTLRSLLSYSLAYANQRDEVRRRQEAYNVAVANYITQVALQAAMLPPQQQIRRPPPGRSPTVRRRPPTQRAPQLDWGGLADRLQGIRSLTGR